MFQVLNRNIKHTKKEIWEILSAIPDPEIPVITIVELGVIRSVSISNDSVIIHLTPTYSGCPATDRFKKDIVEGLHKNGIEKVELILQYSPAWTTDWLTEDARKKLKKFGIAPPIDGTEDKGFLFESGPKIVPCVKCNSENTEKVSQFGSTACKALYKCKDCLEPFEYFKCI